jgi:hypothetical protein
MWLSLRLITQGDDDPQQKWEHDLEEHSTESKYILDLFSYVHR